MSRSRLILSGALVVSLAASGWLFVDNRALRSELAKSDRQATAAATKVATAAADDATGAGDAKPDDKAKARRPSLLSRWMFGNRQAERPEVKEEPAKESRVDRRKRRQAEISAMFGRLDGETAEEYRERMVPFVKMALAGPRTRVDDARKLAEEAAGVTDDQRQQIDEAFDDAYNEIISLTNQALDAGDLTPYSRNWSGVLNFAGGLGAVLEGAEGRVNKILSPEQIETIYDQGFEWGEYMGVSVPWEELNAPPPPPGS